MWYWPTTQPTISPFARTAAAAPVLELENQLSDDIKKLVTEHDYDAKPAVYCELLSAIDKDHLELILLRAGINRFEGKIKRFNTALSLSSFDQIFYEGIFEALGYTKNSSIRYLLRKTLPLLQLREFKEAGMTQDELFSIYLGSSGLLYRKGEIMPAEDRERAQKIYEAQTWYARSLILIGNSFASAPRVIRWSACNTSVRSFIIALMRGYSKPSCASQALMISFWRAIAQSGKRAVSRQT